MFAPKWKAGCLSCSFWADDFDRNIVHLAHRDVPMRAVSRAPYPKIAAYKKRMGWSFKWLSSFGTDLSVDYQASARPEDLAKGRTFYNFAVQKRDPDDTDQPGVSVFFKGPRGAIFHTYST